MKIEDQQNLEILSEIITENENKIPLETKKKST